MPAPHERHAYTIERRDLTQPHDHTSPARKPFVEPAISSPIDVLAATTFFQVVDSGGTLRRPARHTD
jgi:hypothetical protein